ncbi:fungal-specific transcription factor domain-containing protein [Aspergillus karnatakaensis]|uniref:transcription factor domain-containing protein n=1 Tax=Aspergillus karnatakaensis TaxID=1810916 RepID=UPI003CCE532C
MAQEYSCEKCGCVFQRREHYKRHYRTHTNEKPFSCSNCGQSFGRIDSLSRHYSTLHADQGPKATTATNTRVAQACRACSTSKVRCDGNQPCQKCTRIGTQCLYGLAVNKRKNGEAVPATVMPKRSKVGAVGEASPTQSAMGSNRTTTTSGSVPLPESGITSGGANSAEQVPGLTHLAISTDVISLHSSREIVEDDPNPNGSAPQSVANIAVNSTDFDNALREGFDSTLMSGFQLEAALESMQDFSLPQDFGFFMIHMDLMTLPSSFDAASAADFYSRSHSPAMCKEDVEIRHYTPTAPEIDAPLIFPDLENVSLDELEGEDYAHVPDVTVQAREETVSLIEAMEHQPHHPRFIDLRIPPSHVLNVWIQLYFERFHPVFPILHRPTFSAKRPHWLLVLAVAAIGAQFSALKDAYPCARALHELIRRQSTFLCEHRNQRSRDVWMLQVVTLQLLGFMFSGERRDLEIAELIQSVPIAMARRKRVINDVLPHERIARPDAPLDQIWHLWILDEERRRLGFAIWLIDSAFSGHFELTTVSREAEYQNSLPQCEDRWNAPTAQSWLSLAPGLASGRNQTLIHIEANGIWSLVWGKTGVLGKEVMLQHHLDIVTHRNVEGEEDKAASSDCSSSLASARKLHTAETLQNLLYHMESMCVSVPFVEIKPLTVHRIMALGGLMLFHSPTVVPQGPALKRIYGHLKEEGIQRLSLIWQCAATDGRLALYYAVRIFELARKFQVAHPTAILFIYRATLIMWLYSLLSENIRSGASEQSDIVGSRNVGSVILGGTDCVATLDMTEWIESGIRLVKVSGIGILDRAEGRKRLLDEAISLFGAMKSWGVAKTYELLLIRLKVREDDEIPAK